MYTTATFDRLEQNADGTAVMVFRYTGTGEEPRESKHSVNTAVMPTADYARGLAMARMAVLNTNRSFLIGAQPSVGTVLDTTTPLPTPVVPIFGSYCAASVPFTPGATPQDVFAITGSATTIVQVLCIGLTTVQTTAGMNAWSLLKRSTANTGGTSALVAGVPTNDAYPAPTATVRQYTANPTAGTVVGSLWTGRVSAPVPGSTVSNGIERVLSFNQGGSVTLTGIADVLAWNFGGVALPAGLSVQAWVWWNETS